MDLIPAVEEVIRGGTYICPALQGHLPGFGRESVPVPKNAPPMD
jgi:hypothetical protein